MSLPHKELQPKDDGAVQGTVPDVDGGESSQESRQIVTGFRGDADSAEAGSSRAGGLDQEHTPMSENTHEGQPPASGGDELLTRPEVGRRLRIHPSTVDSWREKYGLPAIEKGSKVYFDWPDVKAWLKSKPQKARRRKRARKGSKKRQGKAGEERPVAREIRRPKPEGRSECRDGDGAAEERGADA